MKIEPNVKTTRFVKLRVAWDRDPVITPIGKYRADGILCHGNGFRLGVAFGDDLRQRRHADREATFGLWLQNNRKVKILNHDDPSRRSHSMAYHAAQMVTCAAA